MKGAIEAIFSRYGTQLTFCRAGAYWAGMGMLQAVNFKSWQSLESQATLLGEVTRGQYLYLGPVDNELKEADEILLGDKTYLVRRVGVYHWGQTALYQWGMCVERGVNDTWQSLS